MFNVYLKKDKVTITFKWKDFNSKLVAFMKCTIDGKNVMPDTSFHPAPLASLTLEAVGWTAAVFET